MELFQWLFFEWFTPSEFFQFSQLSNSLVSLKNANDVHKKAQFGLGLKLQIELKINFNQAQNW